MTDTKKKRLIGVMAAVVVTMVTVTGCKNSDEDVKDLTENDNITANITPIIDENKTTESITPQITEEPVTPNVTAQPVEVEPAKANLDVYKGIKAIYSPKEITDEDINNELEKLQKENSYYINLPDRPFQEGDMVVVTINAFADGRYIEDISVYCIQVVLGKGSLPDFIEDAIIKNKKKQYVDAYFTYPDDFENKEIAGKTVRYNIELVDGFEYYVPDITDSFIKENTGYTSLTEYKTKTKERLQEDENSRAYDEMVDALKHNLINYCTYSGDVDYEIKRSYVLKTQQYNSEAVGYGYPDAATMYMFEYNMSAEEYQNMVKSEAEFEVKYQLALDEIVMAEKLSDSYPEYSKEELRNVAEQLVIDSADVDGENY